MAFSRAQSEVVGVVLLTAVIVLVVAVTGTVVLSTLESETERDPLADIESTVNETTVTIQHQGGDSFDPAAIELRAVGDTACTATLTDSSVTTDDGSQFAPGTVWVYDPPESCLSGGPVTVFVIDTKTNTILHERRHDNSR